VGCSVFWCVLVGFGAFLIVFFSLVCGVGGVINHRPPNGLGLTSRIVREKYFEGVIDKQMKKVYDKDAR